MWIFAERLRSAAARRRGFAFCIVALFWVPSLAQAQSCRAPRTDPSDEVAPPEAPSCAGAGRAGLRAVAFVYSAPHLALERPMSRAFRYAAYPFADGEPGLLRFGEPVAHLHNPKDAFVAGCQPEVETSALDRDDVCARRGPLGRQRGQLRAALGASLAEAGRVRGLLEGEVRLLTRVRLEPALELSAYRHLSAPAATAYLGRAAVDYRFAQSARLSLTSGLTALGAVRAGAWRGGGALRYGLRAYVRSGWSVRALGSLGGLAGAFYGRVAAFVERTVGRVQLGLGYDHVTLRSREVTRLSGPRLALTLWL